MTKMETLCPWTDSWFGQLKLLPSEVGGEEGRIKSGMRDMRDLCYGLPRIQRWPCIEEVVHTFVMVEGSDFVPGTLIMTALLYSTTR